jgi:hypothetical protein
MDRISGFNPCIRNEEGVSSLLQSEVAPRSASSSINTVITVFIGDFFYSIGGMESEAARGSQICSERIKW